ncbi:COX15/CtaA family protein [Candidatus Pelagibacter sp.]|nr:COX15/CtaA family protein [Candidatus Pelagibacter sp.]
MYIENLGLKKSISSWLLFMFWIISIMIVVGGLTRLTDSGLSITEWELFAGFLPPLNDNAWNKYFDLYKEIPEFKLQNYDMTMNEFKIIFWWEWIHRFLGRLIGITFLIPLIYFTYRTGFKKMLNLYMIFLLICFQGFIGWYMVSSGLVDRVDVSHFRLAVHLMIAFIILSLIFWNYLDLKGLIPVDKNINFNLSLLLLIVVYAQITIGAFVSGMDAGTIYNTWPLMGSNYFPDDNKISNLFSLSAFSDASLVQFLHRNLAYLIIFIYLYIVFKIYRYDIKRLYTSINLIGLFLIIQVILGILTLLHGAQIYLASMHQISSIFLVSSCIYFLYLNKQISN